MKYAIILALALLPSTCFAQQVRIIRSDGTVEIIRQENSSPTVMPIKPYGLNLKPYKQPTRKNPYIPRYQPPARGPKVIINPYFPVQGDFPHPETSPKVETFNVFVFIGALIGEFVK